MSASQLLGAARAVSTRPIPALKGRWQVTVVGLLRQAIEVEVEQWFEDQGLDVDRCNGREKFLLLSATHPDHALVAELQFAHDRLSDAVHAATYASPPAASELERWFSVVKRFVEYKQPD